MKIVLLLALVAGAVAECPEACNGHGFCGEYDKCSCYRNYQGNSCADRSCPFDLAFVDLPHGDLNMDGKNNDDITMYGAHIGDINAYEVYPTDGYQDGSSTLEKAASFYDQAEDGHFYAECSNKGMCDRKSGQCDCFDGYSGTACRRVACPNDCSGHGTCETLDEYTAAASNSDTRWADGTAVAYTLWDRYKTQVCQCDAGYFGIDCAQRHCPFGDDPLTTDQHNEIQWLEIKSTVAAEALAGTFTLSYEDEFGEIWDTKPIAARDYDIATDANNDKLEAAIKNALQGIPNSVFEEVAVEVWPIQQPLPGHFTCVDDATGCTLTAAETTLWTTGHVDTALATANTHGISNCLRGTAGKHMTTVAGASGALVQANSEAAGTLFGTAATTSMCSYWQHGVRAKITFTKNPGNLRELKCDKSTASTATAAATSTPDSGVACTVVDSLAFTYASVQDAAGTAVKTNADFSAFMTHGDRFTVGGNTRTIAGPIVQPVGTAFAVILVEEATSDATITIAATGNPAGAWNGAGTTERVECSHRGLCNHDDGLCECFTGYTHDDCSMQDALNA